MLKICYNTCCGIDVHKKMLVATIATTNERKVTTYQTKQFSTFTKDIKKLTQKILFGLLIFSNLVLLKVVLCHILLLGNFVI